ncbi:hypothetical protein Tco_0043660, partial [Tanacetum coccineum]
RNEVVVTHMKDKMRSEIRNVLVVRVVVKVVEWRRVVRWWWIRVRIAVEYITVSVRLKVVGRRRVVVLSGGDIMMG